MLDFCFDCNVRYNVRPTRLEVHGGLGAAAVKHTAHNLWTPKHEGLYRYMYGIA